MAVLKRFSYDNIVEHNPTAPDPVEGGGEGGGDGGAGVFLVTFVDGDTLTCDKTLQEINAAYAAGNLIMARFVYIKDGETFPINPQMPCSALEPDMACFYCVYTSNGKFFVRSIEYNVLGISVYEKGLDTGEA